MKNDCFKGVAAFAIAASLAAPGPAIAAAAASAPSMSEASATTGASDTPPAAEENRTDAIPEITVTAERRTETIQRSSLAITAYSGDQLKAVTSPAALTALSPGVQVSMPGPQPQVYIRGVGDQTQNSRGQGAVSFNIDGVYYGRGTQVGPQMFDIERMEILKGPQGTLYGRNASGGAVNIITANPRLDEVSGYVSGELGNYDARRLTGAVNLPIGSVVAIRVAGQVNKRDGYLSNGENDIDTKAARAKILIQPSDGFSLLINGDISELGGKGAGRTILPEVGDNPWRSHTQVPLVWPFLFNASTAPLTRPDDAFINSKNHGVSMEANADLGFAKLTFLPAYRHQDQRATYYSTDFRYSENAQTEQLTGELRLGNSSRHLKWVTGLYYYNEKLVSQFGSAQGRLSAGDFNTNRTSLGAFAQATVSIVDPLRVIGGLRYTDERVDGTYTSATGILNPPSYLTDAQVALAPFTRTSAFIPVGPQKFTKLNYKVGAEYDVGPQSMLFATYATGFKAGGFGPTRRCGPTFFDPETLDAVTVGMRNRFLDNKLQVNAEAFHWKYNNQQVAVVQPDACGDSGQFVRNVGDATIKGVNLDVVLKPINPITLHAAVEYTDSKYDRFFYTQPSQVPFTPTDGSLCSATLASGAYTVNCAGQPLSRTPKWSLTLGYDHRIEIGEGRVNFGVDAQIASKIWLDTTYLPNGRAPGYMVVNAHLSYTAPSGAWSVEAFVNNLTNEAVYTGGNYHTAFAPNGYRYFVASIQPPRMYGVRAQIKFGGK